MLLLLLLPPSRGLGLLSAPVAYAATGPRAARLQRAKAHKKLCCCWHNQAPLHGVDLHAYNHEQPGPCAFLLPGARQKRHGYRSPALLKSPSRSWDGWQPTSSLASLASLCSNTWLAAWLRPDTQERVFKQAHAERELCATLLCLWQGHFGGGKPHGRGMHKATDGSLYVGTYEVTSWPACDSCRGLRVPSSVHKHADLCTSCLYAAGVAGVACQACM